MLGFGYQFHYILISSILCKAQKRKEILRSISTLCIREFAFLAEQTEAIAYYKVAQAYLTVVSTSAMSTGRASIDMDMVTGFFECLVWTT